MLRKCKLWAGVLTLTAMGSFGASVGRAAVAISIDNVEVLAGGTATVGVYITSTSGDVMTGFNLPLDINNDGYVDSDLNLVSDLPAGFTYAATPLANAVYADTGLDAPFPQVLLYGVDAIPTGTGADVQLSTARTKLFDLVFEVGASVAAGTVVPLQILDLPLPFTGVFTIAGRPDPVVAAPTVGSPVFGSITVVIPEPASVGWLALGVAGLRRRR